MYGQNRVQMGQVGTAELLIMTVRLFLLKQVTTKSAEGKMYLLDRHSENIFRLFRMKIDSL